MKHEEKQIMQNIVKAFKEGRNNPDTMYKLTIEYEDLGRKAAPAMYFRCIDGSHKIVIKPTCKYKRLALAHELAHALLSLKGIRDETLAMQLGKDILRPEIWNEEYPLLEEEFLTLD